MEIYLIRHGETDWNKSRRMQGQTDIPLNENGRELARRTGAGMRDISFTRAISSPLKRARETAKLVLEGRDLMLQTDPRIAEICFGVFEGLSGINKAYPVPDPKFHYFFDAPEKYRAPDGGETLEQLIGRTGDFLRDLAVREYEGEIGAEEKVLISTHGAAYRALLANVEGACIRDFWREGVPENCAVSIAKLRKGKWTILERDRLYYARI